MDTQQQKDVEIDIFARFFGNLLVDLKKHDLRLPRQNWEGVVGKESPIEFIKHVR